MPPPIRQGMTALRCNEWVSDAPGRLRAKHRTSLPRRHTRSTACARGLKRPLSQQKSLLRVKITRNHRSCSRSGRRTASSRGVVLDSSTLTVELIVGNPRGLGLGRVETALGSRADRCSTLGHAGDVAGEHGGRWFGVLEGRGSGRRRNPSRFSGFP